jgi:micrococcal nuclease
MKKRIKIFLWIILAVLLIVLNYNFIDKEITDFLKDYKIVQIARVIDGDTIVTTSNEHIRMLGINSPEKGEKFHDEALQSLVNLVNNKTVKLETEGIDLYNRTLAYVFLNDENINLQQVRSGLANFYFPESTKTHYSEITNAWSKCLEENKNLCEKSKDKCAECIMLTKLDYKSQEAVFYNNCSFSCNLNGWWIKDEGRKEFVFHKFILNHKQDVTIKVGNKSNNQSVLFWAGETYVWTRTGDTLFLRDENGKLVLWKNY